MDTVGFTRMAEGTREEYAFLERLWEQNKQAHLADNVLRLLTHMKGPTLGYRIDRYRHSLQTATRALRDGADEETVVCALLHDVGDSLAPDNHGEVAAAVLRPYVSERNHWVIKHHGLFQGYYYFHHVGGDRNARDRYRGHPHFEACADFCARWDQASFDPDYDTRPLEAFEPMVRRVLARATRVRLTETMARAPSRAKHGEDRMGEDIRLSAGDGHELAAYRARPEGTPRGGVVVIQEIFGVNRHIRDVCEGFARAGYLAVAPALFDRVERGVELDYTPGGMTRGREIRAGIDMADVIKDAAAAADAAAEAGKVAIVGYCWGGLIVYVAACRLSEKLACASGYYGANIKNYLSETPAIPLMLHFGTLDQSIPMGEVDDIRAAHPEVAVHVYEGADHGFNCDRRQHFHPDSANLARERTLAFFAEHLG